MAVQASNCQNMKLKKNKMQNNCVLHQVLFYTLLSNDGGSHVIKSNQICSDQCDNYKGNYSYSSILEINVIILVFFPLFLAYMLPYITNDSK